MRLENRNLLVVDDNPEVLSMLKLVLEQHKHNVLTAANGEEAFKTLSDNNVKVDLIISDLMMPTLDGLSFLKHLRNETNHWDTPFIFLTAADNPNDMEEAKKFGADDFIPKPFNPETLLTLVQSRIDRSETLKKVYEEMFLNFRKSIVQTLSHEFKTPLLAVTAGSDYLMSQDLSALPPAIKETVAIVNRGSRRLKALVEDFLSYQKIEAGTATEVANNKATLTNISSEILEFIELQRSKGQFNISLQIEEEATNVELKIYKPQILDALQRLISNAEKFSPKKSEISVKIFVRKVESEPQQELIIQVKNKGKGIPSHKINQAKDCFIQLDRDYNEQQGVGLGLTIAEKYIQANGGQLNVIPQLNKDSDNCSVEISFHIPNC